LRASVTLTR
jgi:hypothetical protein